MNRKLIKKILTAAMCFDLLFVMSACGENAGTEDGSSEIEVRSAVIFSLNPVENSSQGEVTVLRQKESIEAYQGMRLNAGDSISTDENGSVYLRIDDDKNILLGKSTTMELTEVDDGNLKLSLSKGEFMFDVENKIPDGENMSFDIGGTTMSIRGTSGFGMFREEECRFGLYEGKVSAQSASGKTIDVNAFEKISFNNGEDVPDHADALADDDFGKLLETYIEVNEHYTDRADGVEDRIRVSAPDDGERTEENIETDTQSSDESEPYTPATEAAGSNDGNNSGNGNIEKDNTGKQNKNDDDKVTGDKDKDKEGEEDNKEPTEATPTDKANDKDNADVTDKGEGTHPPVPYYPYYPYYPTEPHTPATQTDPSSPATPTEPATQTDPSSPATPTEPATQTDPSSPATPTEPATQTDPSSPATPTEPATQTDPSSPATPTEPATQTDPSSPATPTEPATQTDPSSPATPTEPANEICPHCGNFSDEGNHEPAPCGDTGHYLCDGQNHIKAECGEHWICLSGGFGHERAACGHYTCISDNLDHKSLGCGHYPCSGENDRPHRLAECGEHWFCKLDEEEGDEESHRKSCPGCGNMLCSEEYKNIAHHEQLPTGEYLCQG